MWSFYRRPRANFPLNAAICLALTWAALPFPLSSSLPLLLPLSVMQTNVQLRRFSSLSPCTLSSSCLVPSSPPSSSFTSSSCSYSPSPPLHPSGHKQAAACAERAAGSAPSVTGYPPHIRCSSEGCTLPSTLYLYPLSPVPCAPFGCLSLIVGDPAANYMFTAGKAKCKRKHTLTWPAHNIFHSRLCLFLLLLLLLLPFLDCPCSLLLFMLFNFLLLLLLPRYSVIPYPSFFSCKLLLPFKLSLLLAFCFLSSLYFYTTTLPVSTPLVAATSTPVAPSSRITPFPFPMPVPFAVPSTYTQAYKKEDLFLLLSLCPLPSDPSSIYPLLYLSFFSLSPFSTISFPLPFLSSSSFWLSSVRKCQPWALAYPAAWLRKNTCTR